MPALTANYGGAVCGRHAGGGGLYYSAADRKPDGKPEVLGISSGAAFGVVLMLFLVRVMPLAGCYPQAVSGRR